MPARKPTDFVAPQPEYRDPRFAELDALLAQERATACGPQKGRQARKRKRRDVQKHPALTDPAPTGRESAIGEDREVIAAAMAAARPHTPDQLLNGSPTGVSAGTPPEDRALSPGVGLGGAA